MGYIDYLLMFAVELFRAIAIAALVIVLWIIAAGFDPAPAHSWYDTSCCGGQDCAPVPDASVRPVHGGWLIQETGETVPYGSSREHLSPDGRYHVCMNMVAPPLPNGKPPARCLYVPGMGS